MYVVSVEVFLRKVEDLVTHSIITWEDKPYVAATKYVTYGKGLRAAVTFVLKDMGGLK